MKKVVAIVGPTASGKSALGITLGKEWQVPVLSVDSRQVYAGLNIGTGKEPELYTDTAHAFNVAEDVQGVPHYLCNIATPDKPTTLASWYEEASKLVTNLHTERDTLLLVGGTMLYMDSLVYGFTIPIASPDQELRQQLEKESVEELYKQLIAKDPDATAFIQSHNKQRIIRALEVIQQTGQPFSVLRKQQKPTYDVAMYGIFPGWEVLRERVTKRIQQMIQDGLTTETENLIKQYGIDLPLLKTINYAQILAVIQKEYSLEEAQEKMISANMRYAHRQMSWWKRNADITWFSFAEEMFERIKKDSLR